MALNISPFIKDLLRLRSHLDQAISTLSYMFLEGDGVPLTPPLPIKLKAVVLPDRTKVQPQPPAVAPSPAAQQKPPSVRSTSFYGLTAWEAAARYLQVRGKPALTAEIAAALTSGGIQTDSESFRGVLYQAMKKKPETFFSPAKGKWGLREWEMK